ncbi:MAG TPA: tetratricopeptide repeat protein [Candidatus Margulisiibacteriota bacterium]|nr:tetratricopeptide repeat protein [Candidatus Margulisiibacteriota bacterium]
MKQLLSRASSYMTCELFNDAIRSYEKAVFIDKRNVIAWNMLGYSYKSNGELKKALYAYRQALKTDPKDKSVNFSIGVILASEKKYEEAVQYFEKVRVLGPDNISQAVDIVSYHKSSLRLLVTCYDALKEFDKKNNALEELHRYYPEDNLISGQVKPGRLFRQ